MQTLREWPSEKVCLGEGTETSYLQGMSLGIGLSGVGVASISFVTLWWSHPPHHHMKTPAEVAPEAFSYFVLSSIIIAAAVVTYFIFFRMSFVKKHRQPEGGTLHPVMYLSLLCSVL